MQLLKYLLTLLLLANLAGCLGGGSGNTSTVSDGGSTNDNKTSGNEGLSNESNSANNDNSSTNGNSTNNSSTNNNGSTNNNNSTNNNTTSAGLTQPANKAGRLLASNCYQCHGTGGIGGFKSIRGKGSNEGNEYRTGAANRNIMGLPMRRVIPLSSGRKS